MLTLFIMRCFRIMAGVRNFADPNAKVNDGRSVLEQ